MGKRLDITTGKGIGEKEDTQFQKQKKLGLYGWDSENKAMKGPKNV